MIGAAFAAAAPGIPAWATGFDNGNSAGGLVMAVLAPAGGFGKFMLVLIALSTSGACAPTMYTFGTQTQYIVGCSIRLSDNNLRGRCERNGDHPVFRACTAIYLCHRL